jgi:hypothetical protein
MRSNIDAMGDQLVAHGILDPANRVENYFTHVLDIAGETKGGGGQFRTPVPKSRKAIITGQRTQQTLADDITAGYRPATLDAFKIYEHFMTEAQTRIAMADIVDDIRKFDPEGVKYLKLGESAPEGFSTVRHPMFEGMVAVDVGGTPRIIRHRWAVRSNVARYVKALAEQSAVRESAVGRGALRGTASVKRFTLGGPLDINFFGFEAKAASYAVGSDVRKIIPGALNVAIRGQEGFDTFLRQTVEYAGQQMPRSEAWARLDRAGLTGASYRTEISRMLGDEVVPTPLGLIPGPGKWYDNAQGVVEAAQFDRAIPALKHESAAILVQRKVAKGMPLEAAEREAAHDINRAMGGLNRIAMGRSRTSQDLRALLLIAPDWMESRLKNFGAAFLPGSNNATARRFMARSMLTGGVFTAVGSTVYAQERGWDEEQTARYIAQNLNPVVMRDGKPQINPHWMQFQLPNGQWTSPLTWELDGWRLMFGAAAFAGGDTETANLLIGNYFSARLNAGPRLPKDYIVNRDFRGLPIRTEKGWPGVWQYLQYEGLQSATPAFGRELATAALPSAPGGEQSVGGALHNLTGLGRTQTFRPMETLDRAVQDEKIAKTGGGTYMRYSDLPPDIRGEFEKRHPGDVAELRKYRADRERDQFGALRDQTNAGLGRLGEQLASGEITAEQYRQQAGEFVSDQALLGQTLREELELEGQKRSGDLGVLDGYYDAVKPATDPTTRVTDFDQRDKFEAEYRATLTPEQDGRLDAMLGYSADPQYQELKAARQTLAESGYFDRREAAFVAWLKEIPGSSAPPEIKAAAKEWKSVDDLAAYARAETVNAGDGVELFDAHPAYNAWESYSGDFNAEYLISHPAIDDLALQWGYQTRVHSDEAARLYEERTGLKAPVPQD